ncbi:AAA family ATPase [Candidatus Peregrinibacteria bacterium]|nr:AAA family ATPase [Candidatus Peregrinibacteria bacterium]
MSLMYNWKIYGNQRVLIQLERDINGGNLSHAYLFSGPDNVGKYAVARNMAKILQCEGEHSDNPIAKEIDAGYHADTIEIKDDFESVKIEKIRDVIEKMNMTKQSPFKILLLQNLERLTPESGNALLKTLEDPPSNVVFIMTTDNLNEILPTVISRVRNVYFSRLTNDEMTGFLKANFKEADADLLNRAATLSLGRPGKAYDLMSDLETYELYLKMYEDIEQLIQKKNKTDQFMYIESLVNQAKDEKKAYLIKEFLDILLLVLRKELIAGAGGINASIPKEKAVNLTVKILKAKELMKRNVNTRLLLENLMLSI